MSAEPVVIEDSDEIKADEIKADEINMAELIAKASLYITEDSIQTELEPIIDAMKTIYKIQKTVDTIKATNNYHVKTTVMNCLATTLKEMSSVKNIIQIALRNFLVPLQHLINISHEITDMLQLKGRVSSNKAIVYKFGQWEQLMEQQKALFVTSETRGVQYLLTTTHVANKPKNSSTDEQQPKQKKVKSSKKKKPATETKNDIPSVHGTEERSSSDKIDDFPEFPDSPDVEESMVVEPDGEPVKPADAIAVIRPVPIYHAQKSQSPHQQSQSPPQKSQPPPPPLPPPPTSTQPLTNHIHAYMLAQDVDDDEDKFKRKPKRKNPK